MKVKYIISAQLCWNKWDLMILAIFFCFQFKSLCTATCRLNNNQHTESIGTDWYCIGELCSTGTELKE